MQHQRSTWFALAEGVCVCYAGARGRVQKQAFAYLVGPLVQAAALNYQEFPLPAQVCPMHTCERAGGNWCMSNSRRGTCTGQ